MCGESPASPPRGAKDHGGWTSDENETQVALTRRMPQGTRSRQGLVPSKQVVLHKLHISWKFPCAVSRPEAPWLGLQYRNAVVTQ